VAKFTGSGTCWTPSTDPNDFAGRPPVNDGSFDGTVYLHNIPIFSAPYYTGKTIPTFAGPEDNKVGHFWLDYTVPVINKGVKVKIDYELESITLQHDRSDQDGRPPAGCL
jgi:hypothetical protein